MRLYPVPPLLSADRWCLGATIAVIVLSLPACAPPDPYDFGPPDGWAADGSRWWLTGADTTGQFRNLETLEAMGLRGARLTMPADRVIARQREVREEQFARALKVSLLPLFRHRPEVVDSLFERFVRPRVSETNLEGDSRELLQRLKKQAYRTLSRHFREPRAAVRLGRDVPVVYPDSLRGRGVKGTVGMQVYLNEQGEPVSIQLTEPVHPILDDIAMKATTQIRWQPAYVYRRGTPRALTSWVRYGVRFRTEPAAG